MATPAANELLGRYGLAGARLTEIAHDASPRRYFRLEGEGLLLMVYQNDPVGFASYLRVSEHLAALGLSAPRVIGSNASGGFALVEDFGDQTFTACIAGIHNEAELYKLGVDVLLHLHHDKRGTEISQPPFGMEALLGELDIITDWFVPVVAPEKFDKNTFSERFRSLWREALTPVATRIDTLLLRDFHIANLMLLPEREGVARCGLLDFQGAFLGPCEYDLVSLLQDARRDLSAGLEQELIAYYISNAPSRLGTTEEIRRRYMLLGAQRHTRILGVFTRLYRRDDQPRYLGFLSRVLRQLLTALEGAELDRVGNFLDSELPDWKEKVILLATGIPKKRRDS